MNNGRLWDIVHSILKKESKGNTITPDRFTFLLQQCHYEYYNQQYEKFAGSQTITDSMRPFVVTDESVTFTTGNATVASLDNTYKHLIGARVTSGDVAIDIVPPHVWNMWIGDAVMKGTTTYPIMTLDETNLKIYPTSITTAKVSYLKAADNEPFFDYYIDANYDVQYLTEGQSAYTLKTSEVYRDGTTSGDVTSISYDLEWEDMDKVNIISMLLEKIGVSLQAPDVAQYAMSLEQKQNVM